MYPYRHCPLSRAMRLKIKGHHHLLTKGEAFGPDMSGISSGLGLAVRKLLFVQVERGGRGRRSGLATLPARFKGEISAFLENFKKYINLGPTEDIKSVPVFRSTMELKKMFYQFTFLEYDKAYPMEVQMSGKNMVLNREVELLGEFLIDEGRKLVYAILRLNEAKDPLKEKRMWNLDKGYNDWLRIHGEDYQALMERYGEGNTFRIFAEVENILIFFAGFCLNRYLEDEGKRKPLLNRLTSHIKKEMVKIGVDFDRAGPKKYKEDENYVEAFGVELGRLLEKPSAVLMANLSVLIADYLGKWFVPTVGFILQGSQRP